VRPSISIQMLATTIHKSNTTPHHQSRAATRTPDTHTQTAHVNPRASTHPQRDEPAGLLPQDPTVCLAISFPATHPPKKRTDPQTGTLVVILLYAPDPPPLQRTGHPTNRPEHRTPTRCGRA
jgi:hypothetical protein